MNVWYLNRIGSMGDWRESAKQGLFAILRTVFRRIRIIPPLPPFWPSKIVRQAVGTCEISCDDRQSHAGRSYSEFDGRIRL